MKKIVSKAGTLLEGPVWHPKRKGLFFTDILNGTIFEYSTTTETLNSWKVGTYSGTILLNDSEDKIFVAVDDSISELNLNTKEVTKLIQIDFNKEVRFNDGKCDTNGNIVVGTMAIDYNDDGSTNIGDLYRISPNGEYEIIESNLGIPNGMAWSLDHEYFYHIESNRRAVFSYKYDKNTSEVTERKKLIDLTDEGCSPDGMTMDSQGNLWIAMWDGSRVIQVNPNTGEKLREISVPDKQVTCCVFGGENLDQLYITTANCGEEGGNLYVVDLGVTGGESFLFKL